MLSLPLLGQIRYLRLDSAGSDEVVSGVGAIFENDFCLDTKRVA